MTITWDRGSEAELRSSRECTTHTQGRRNDLVSEHMCCENLARLANPAEVGLSVGMTSVITPFTTASARRNQNTMGKVPLEVIVKSQE